MAGIYIHIPFCKQACHYCNFHFTTSLRRKNELVASLLSEIKLNSTLTPALSPGLSPTFFPEGEGKRKYGSIKDKEPYLAKEDVIETIYFGGGTPSLLDIEDCKLIIDNIRSSFEVCEGAEISIETNPDDITTEKMQGWKESGINRLSLGVQSFFDEDLKWMNRAHNANQAFQAIELSLQQGFSNITIDLIYGTPLLTDEKWKANIDTALAYNIPHLSCYALTVEPGTPLQKLVRDQKTSDIDTGHQANQFLLLMNWLEEAGYEHYEISNFARPGFRSRHNSSYWQGKKYSGFGPSAHSFDGKSRQWNISNNNVYIDSINKGIVPFEIEELTSVQQLNEFIMTSLRTIEGMDLKALSEAASYELRALSKKYLENGQMILENNKLKLTKEGKLFADGIAAELFFD